MRRTESQRETSMPHINDYITQVLKTTSIPVFAASVQSFGFFMLNGRGLKQGQETSSFELGRRYRERQIYTHLDSIRLSTFLATLVCLFPNIKSLSHHQALSCHNSHVPPRSSCSVDSTARLIQRRYSCRPIPGVQVCRAFGGPKP